MATPYFLQPNDSASQGEILFQIPIYSNPQPAGVYQDRSMLENVWQNLGDTASELTGDVSDYVFDTAKNAWVSVKESASEVVGSALSKVGEAVDWAKYQVLYLVVGGLLIIWVIAKSGILGQAAGLASAVR